MGEGDNDELEWAEEKERKAELTLLNLERFVEFVRSSKGHDLLAEASICCSKEENNVRVSVCLVEGRDTE